MTRVTVSDAIADRVRDLRNRAELTREQVATIARERGAAEDFTGHVVGFLENGRPKDGVRTRLFALDEVLALAAALEVAPLELLGPFAQSFVGDTHAVSVECPKCAAGAGGMERVTRLDLARLGALSAMESTLVEAAYRLAAAIDAGEDTRALPGLTKELRATVQELGVGRRREPLPLPPEDDFDDLNEPD